MIKESYNNPTISEIRMFWEWFLKNCDNFGHKFENAYLVDELDDRINKLGDFSWEIGPGKIKEDLLVISPNGDPELLQQTMLIVSNAIPCDNWEFYYAKQPKEWEFRFDFETEDGKQVEIDASQWEYVLLRYEDGLFGIVIKASCHLEPLNDDEKLMAAEMVLDSILGEELRIQKICEIDIVGAFDNAEQSKASEIKNLTSHLKKLLGISDN